MNTQQQKEDLEESFRQPIRDLIFATAKIGDRVSWGRATGVFRYSGRRNSLKNSMVFIKTRSGREFEVDASELVIL